MITLQVPTPLCRNNYLLIPKEVTSNRNLVKIANAYETGIIIPILYAEDITPDMLLVPVYSHAGIDICIDVTHRINFYLGNLNFFSPNQVIVSTNDLVGLSSKPTDPMNEMLVFQE